MSTGETNKWPDMTITLTQDEYESLAVALVVFNRSQVVPGQEDNYIHICKQHMLVIDKFEAARKAARGEP